MGLHTARTRALALGLGTLLLCGVLGAEELDRDKIMEVAPVALSSLRAGCQLTREVLRIPVPMGHWHGMWLTCHGERFLVLGPLSLLGQVEIRTPEQALEFVRCFSSYATFDLTGMEGTVEVVPDDGTVDARDFLAVDRQVFAEHLTRPEARSVPQQPMEPRALALRGSQQLTFWVTRTIKDPGGAIYSVAEQVDDDGYYYEASRQPLLTVGEAEALGLWRH
jgi:hypothetical protein